MRHTRRTFLTAASTLAVGTRLGAATVQGANDRIRIGVIGTGGRARGLMNRLKEIGGVDLAAVCDVYEPRILQAAEIAGAGVRQVTDYRRILDDREIDAVLIGAPDHWHRTMTIDAVAAGKDVFVEKPISRTIEEGEDMVRAVEASKQVVQTGTQQRSWDHWILGKQIVDSGRLGQITFVHTYWYQQMRAGAGADIETAKLDWKAWLGPAPDQPFDARRFSHWRHYWDFGGGALTDLMTHWIDVVHWYMGVDAPLTAVATGANHRITHWEAPDTINATLEFPKDFMGVYLGTFNSRIDDGGLEFRGSEGTMKIDRRRLAVYRDDGQYLPGTHLPEPEIFVRSGVDGTIAHLQNWLDCIRSRQKPNADIRSGHIAARTAHIGNAALRGKQRVRWNGRVETATSA
jgi:predicted dehydrogenase